MSWATALKAVGVISGSLGILDQVNNIGRNPSYPNAFPIPPANWGRKMGEADLDRDLYQRGFVPSPDGGDGYEMGPGYEAHLAGDLRRQLEAGRQSNQLQKEKMDLLFPGTTPWERLGTPAASGGQTIPAGSPAGTIGPMFQAAVQGQIAKTQMQTQLKTARMSQQTEIGKAMIAAAAQRDVAGMHAGERRYQTDMETMTRVEANRIQDMAIRNLDSREREKIRIQWKQYQIAREKGDREAETQSAAFILHRQLLSMGPENVRASFLALTMKQQYGVDLVSPDGKLPSQGIIEKILDKLRAEGSYLYKEFSALMTASGRFSDWTLDRKPPLAQISPRPLDANLAHIQ